MVRCRRYPPQLVNPLFINESRITEFPLVLKHSWCGEWQTQPETSPYA